MGVMSHRNKNPNFIWPKNLRDLKGNLDDIYVTKIFTVAANGKFLGDIRFELSNGQESEESGNYMGMEDEDILELG